MFDSVFYPIHANFRAEVPKYVKPQPIKVSLNKLENGGINTLKSALSRATTKALKDLEKAIEQKDAKAIESYQFTLLPELERSLLGLWLGGWGIGRKHGGNEIKAQQKKGKANFEEEDELLGAELASIENVQAQEAIYSRANTLAQDVSQGQWESIRGHLLAAVQPQAETGYPINRSELLKRINTELGDSGFGKRAEKIARTELTFAYNSGRLQTYKDSGLVSHVVFLSILDDRRCLICEDRHGMLIAMDDIEEIAANTPPMHVNCRCVLSPRLKTPENQQELETEEKQSKKRRLSDAPPKWLAAGILAAIILSRNTGKIPRVSRSVQELADVVLASQIQAIANATQGTAVARARRTNQIPPLPSGGVIEIQPKVMLNGIDLNTATPEEIRESLKEFLKPNQMDELISYLQENKLNSIDDLLSVKGITRKSKAFKSLQELADKDKLRIELQQIKTPSELWLKNLGFSRSESKTIFEELKDKPAQSWDELRQRLKNRGISGDKLQRAIDKLKSIETESQRKVVGLDDYVELKPATDQITKETKELTQLNAIRQRDISLQRRQDALEEIKDLQLELARIREDESRFNVRLRRMNRRNPKEFVTPEQIRVKQMRQARIQSQIEKAQQKAMQLGRQLEKAKLAMSELDIPELTPAAKTRTQVVENLGLEGTQLSNQSVSLSQMVQKEIDTQMSRGLIPPKKRLANLEQANNKAAIAVGSVDEVIQGANLETAQARIAQIEEHYQKLLDPFYPENYFGRDIQNELTSLKAELKRVKSEIDSTVKTLQRAEQNLSSATTQAEANLGKMRLLKTGTQLEQQAKELEDQIQDWGSRVKRTRDYERTTEPINRERLEPLGQMGDEAVSLRQKIPQFRQELDRRFRPGIDNAKGTISEINQRREQLEQLQKQVDEAVRKAEQLPISKGQIPEADVSTYNTAVELRKISREITEETKRLKTLAGANRVNLDDSIKTQNKLYQQYEQQRFGADNTPSWEKNISPAIEARVEMIDNATRKLDAIAKEWNIGFLIELGQTVEAGTDAAGKTLRVRKWLIDNGLSPEDLSLSGGGRKVGYEAIRDLADETLKQYGIIQGTTKAIKNDAQFKMFSDQGLVTEENLLKWAESQAAYWQGQRKKLTSGDWQGSSYEKLDELWKSLQGKKANDLDARKSIKSDDVQGQLRRTVAKYQDWQRKYALLKDKGDVSEAGIRRLNEAQKQLLDQQNELLEQLDKYNLDAAILINENADNTRQIWEKVKSDSQRPVFFDVKGKAIERDELIKQLEATDKRLKEYLKIKERPVEPLTYDAKKATPLIVERDKLAQELREIEPKISELQNQIQSLTQAKRGTKRLDTQLAKLQTEQTAKQRRLNEVIQEARDLRLPPAQYQQIQSVKQQISQTQKQIAAIESEIAILRRELTTLSEQPLGGSASGVSRQNRVNALEEAIARKNNDLFKVVEVINSQRETLGRLRAGSY